MAAGKVRRQTINLASGQGSTLVDVVDLIAAELGKTPVVHAESTRPGEVTRYVANLARARELLGYAPQIQLATGVPRAIQWQRENGFV